jgi:hypothetical protein
MENKHPHFSLTSLKPSLLSLQASAQKLLASAGGSQAVLDDALGLIEQAMASDNIPLSLVEQVVILIADAIKAQAKP